MANSFFKFKHFTIHQEKCAMKVSTDACLFGAWMAQQQLQENLLDIGTGTGLLSCMIAQKHSNIVIDAIERDLNSYEQAKENIAINNFNNIKIIYQDFFDYTTSKKYGTIVCNPPFYKNHLKASTTSNNTAKHFDDTSFNLLFNKIYQIANNATTVYLLLASEQYENILSIMNSHNIFENEIVYIKHKASLQNIRVMIKASLVKSKSIHHTEIIIKNESETYTTLFCSYLKDYYLAL